MRNNEYQIGSKIVQFDYKVKETIESVNIIFILLEIPYSESELNNVYAMRTVKMVINCGV